MPVTLVDRLPLPNLKVYTAGSFSLLSIAIYYAVNVTSNPNWRVNATLGRNGAAEPGASEAPATAQLLAANGTRDITEQFVDVMHFMMQEPLCMGTVINSAYCLLAVFGCCLQRMVFGQLRVSEAQSVKDKFWNYVFYKFIFVFGVINVQFMDEVLLWSTWFTLLGILHLLSQLCKDRYEYLSSSPQPAGWAHVRLASLLAGILLAGAALLVSAALWGLPAGADTFTFMAAECILVVVRSLHVCARYVLLACDTDAASPAAYYTHLVFDSVSLGVEAAHVVHMVVASNMVVSLASLVLLLQLRHLLHELHERLRRHRLYTSLANHMTNNYPMASKEEMEKNQDNCAICWEPMKEARKLPCSHLFHNGCLCQWVQQDASCPTCRRALAAPAPRAAQAHRHPNHLFHFDGSRYVSWLPSFSVEVTRREPRPAEGAVAAEAAALQRVFPQYTLTTLAADLQRTRSAHLTLDNILEGRLPPTEMTEEPPASEPPASGPPTAEPAMPFQPVSPVVAPVRVEATPAHAEPHVVLGAPEPAATVSASTSTGDLTHSTHVHDGRFSVSATEREASLRRRKEQLVRAARDKYLARNTPTH